MMNWNISQKISDLGKKDHLDILEILLNNRGLKSQKEIDNFLKPQHPNAINASAVFLDKKALAQSVKRIAKAIRKGESIVVYADYDADGITAGTIMWETLYALGGRVMPYIPGRIDEGYGLSEKGINNVKEAYDPTLLITVDQGITGRKEVEYARSLGIEIIVTDHHALPKKLPECTIIHTTQLAGAGVSWFTAREVFRALKGKDLDEDLLAVCAIGTISDMMPLTNVNRSLVKYGLEALNKTNRVGLKTLIKEARIDNKKLSVYDISFVIAPRLNAVGRLKHAMDAMRLMCTNDQKRAELLSAKLNQVNQERKDLTVLSTSHAIKAIEIQLKDKSPMKLLFTAHASYNPGIIGLIAGRLTEKYQRPAIVVSMRADHSKASARSIRGFNIVDAVRKQEKMLIDVGGHPMAAGFTIKTDKIDSLKKALINYANREITDEMLIKTLDIDIEIPLFLISKNIWNQIQRLKPFGIGNKEPVFVSKNVKLLNARVVGADRKHLKIQVADSKGGIIFDAIGFSLGERLEKLNQKDTVDVAFTIDLNEWNGKKNLQLKLKDIR